MKVLSVASEIYPLIKTGGLADVAGALPPALAGLGVEVRTLVPGYPQVLARAESIGEAAAFTDLMGGPARLVAARAENLELFVLDAPHLFARPGGPYGDAAGRDWPDNAIRFAALAQMASAVGLGTIAAFVPDVVHAHDWQAGLAPAYLHYSGGRRPGTVMTVHNLAFQGSFPPELLGFLGLPAHAFTIEGVEYFGRIGFLKAGLRLADRLSTVSPTYAAEITTPEGGMGLGGLLAARAPVLSGILNGIDETVWNPGSDPHLAEPYSAGRWRARAENKRALQDRLGLRASDGPLLGVISRLSWQKGLDLLIGELEPLLGAGAQLALLGSGDPAMEHAFRGAAARNPGSAAVVIGYDEALAHLIQAGSDALLVPSRFEPCGLTQLCAMRYGAVPIVSRVGGLNDTIIDANEMALAARVATGFQFSSLTQWGLRTAVGRALSTWKDPKTWRKLQANGMAADVGWRRPAARYRELYAEAASAAR